MFVKIIGQIQLAAVAVANDIESLERRRVEAMLAEV